MGKRMNKTDMLEKLDLKILNLISESRRRIIRLEHQKTDHELISLNIKTIDDIIATEDYYLKRLQELGDYSAHFVRKATKLL